jgi:hypothetical protein
MNDNGKMIKVGQYFIGEMTGLVHRVIAIDEGQTLTAPDVYCCGHCGKPGGAYAANIKGPFFDSEEDALAHKEFRETGNRIRDDLRRWRESKRGNANKTY